MNTLKRTVGLTLLSLPFAVATGGMLATGGVALAVQVWGCVLVMAICIFGGIALISSASH